LVGTRVTPNQLTTLRLLTGLAACGALAVGGWHGNLWGGVLWVLSAFLDRADGELARLANAQSPGGHLYDYVTDVLCTTLFFIAVGFGLRHGALGNWAVALGLVAGLSVGWASLLSEALEQRKRDGIKAYEGAGGFDFDDIMYLFGPIAWLSLLSPLLVGAAVGGPAFAILTWLRLRRA